MIALLDTILPHLIWAGAVLYLVARLERLFRPVLELRAQQTAEHAAVDVPNDLMALAGQERELWAQEETLRAMRERYDALGDWNKVRSAFGIGRLD